MKHHFRSQPLGGAALRAVLISTCCGGLEASGAGLPAHKLLDAHCHTAGTGAGASGCFVSDAMRRSFKFRWYLRAFGTSHEEIRREGDAIVLQRISERLARSRYVDRAVVLAMDGVIDAQGELDREQTEIYVPNEFVSAQVRRHPNLLFGASINPYRSDALERLERVKAEGAVLVKWLPSIQMIDPADPRLIPFYRKLVELDMPLLTHTGTEHSFTRAANELADPERLRLPLSHGVTVIAAHAGGGGRFQRERGLDRLARLMGEYPSLYADISALTLADKRGHLPEIARRAEFSGRLIYGSDYPLTAIAPLVSPWYQLGRLRWGQCRALAQIRNPWDQDVALKQALGVSEDLWTRGEAVLLEKRLRD